MKSVYTLYFSLVFCALCNQINAQSISSISTKSKESDKLQVSTDSMSKKEIIHAYSKVLTEEDRNTKEVHYYEFKNYDQNASIQFFSKLVNDVAIMKFCPSYKAFALVTEKNYSTEELQTFAKSLGLQIKPITYEAYLADLKSTK